MWTAQSDVEQWNTSAGVEMRSTPYVGSSESARHWHDMIEEELDEYLDAALDGDIVEIADGLADILFLTLGAAGHHGIDLGPIFQAVVRSNFSKFDEDGEPVPHPKIPGKIGKSAGYFAPTADIEAELEAQGYEG